VHVEGAVRQSSSFVSLVINKRSEAKRREEFPEHHHHLHN
jgi:hypothetical protein